MGNSDKHVMAGCLDGIRVLELARYQAGPRCGVMLSDGGAEVIKIEKTGGEASRKSNEVVNLQIPANFPDVRAMRHKSKNHNPSPQDQTGKNRPHVERARLERN